MKAVNPTTKQLINRTALAILAAYALTTVHHIYGGLVDGAPNRLRVPGIMAIPSLVALGSLRRYKRTGSGAALATSTTVAVLAWVVLSGLLHGGYAHAYKDILFLVDGSPKLYYPLNPDEHYPPDDIFFEITGVLETVTAYFIALFTYRLIRDRQQRGHPASAQGQVIPSRQP
ncbi:MAG TPA: hypothetical protein VKA82_09200 [Rubrobacter sp.]|jgi:hypothetical protein|nr:hypothetical protein [Rubrobacter sp.]